MKELLKKLLSVYGPTGREENVAAVIREIVAPYVDETRIDALGNLICTRHGAGKKLMFAAHMDHIGFVVTDIDEKGFLRVFNVGGINWHNSLNRHVVFGNGVSGIMTIETQDYKDHIWDPNHMFIDIGASSKAEAEKLVSLGDVAVYAPDFFDLGVDMIAGPAMDNRVGCALLIGLLKAMKEKNNEVVAVFTTQEEVGLRGATAAAYDVNPDIGIALDITITGDTPNSVPKVAMKAGEGPCVKIMDRSVVCSPKVVSLMEEAAERAGVKYQREVLTMGGTDAGGIQLTRAGVHVGVLSIACRYAHSACEAVSVADIEAGVQLLAAFADKKM